MKISKEAKTAVIAIFVIALSIWGYNYLKGKNIIKPTDDYFVIYENVDGLIESGTVFFRGYKVGKINAINYDTDNPNQFVLHFVLENRIKIPVGSKVLAFSSNPIAGAKNLKIIFSDSEEYYESGDTLVAAYGNTIDELMSKAENIMDGIDSTLTSINLILDQQTEDNLKASIASIQRSVLTLEYSLKKGSLNAAFSNLQDITGNLKAKNDEIGIMIDNMAAISDSLESADIKQTLSKLDSTLASTSEIVAKINEGEGTMGMLINDSTLYTNLANSTASLDSLLVDLKENPSRYVKVSVFGKKDK